MKHLFFSLALCSFVLFSCTKKKDPFDNGNTGGNVPVATGALDYGKVHLALNMELNAKKRKLDENEFTPKNRAQFATLITDAVVTRTASSATMEVEEIERLARNIEAMALQEAATRCPQDEDRILAYNISEIPSIGTGKIGERITIQIQVSYLLGCKSGLASAAPPSCSLSFPVDWIVQGTTNGQVVPPGLANCLESDISTMNNNFYCQYSSGIPSSNTYIQFEAPTIISGTTGGVTVDWSDALYHQTVYWDSNLGWWPSTSFTQGQYNGVLNDALAQAASLANTNWCTGNPNEVIYIDFQIRNAWYLPQGNGGLGTWNFNNTPPLGGGSNFSQSDYVLHRYIEAQYYYKDCTPPYTPCL